MAYHLQTFSTGWCIIGGDAVPLWLGLPPQSNVVGLQARGLLDVLFTCSPKVWVRVWTAVCLSLWPLDRPLTCPGCYPDGCGSTRQPSAQQKQCYKMDGWKWVLQWGRKQQNRTQRRLVGQKTLKRSKIFKKTSSKVRPWLFRTCAEHLKFSYKTSYSLGYIKEVCSIQRQQHPLAPAGEASRTDPRHICSASIQTKLAACEPGVNMFPHKANAITTFQSMSPITGARLVTYSSLS